MQSRLHNRRGFTLIELMIVVVIIGVLAAMAIPRFMKATIRTKQSEAKQILKQIYTMQHTYRQANSSYGDNGMVVVAGVGGSFPQIGVEVQPSARYNYSITCTPAFFTATATANIDDDASIDIWTITESGTLACTTNDESV